MKKIFTILLIISVMTTQAQDIQALQDRMDLKHLVDTFSNLADTKNVDAQLLLFTKDAVVESISNSSSSSKLVGHEQIGTAFKNFLGLFETVYHQNGQQTVEINGDTASGTAYCTVVLIGNNDGLKTMTTMGVRYQDQYVRMDGKWLIAKRISNFMWQDVKSIE
ncbi:nuclear transport factor 2 family protein [Maribacter litopenaei]|uniref:Nuclear transport factor 2 family protein n=1 Tax=Maribacter litopenaei TaxID=2976127 RepID=A0ABY5Y650_9FLAO|nr:nuclear transport factor 2 family protein [Maribacter litopenaei]UWX54517.1 nuclear transport factor 2 family protein [Maribacter litopenaei]